MPKNLTEIEASILLRISPTLLRWLTGHAPKHNSKRKLFFTEKDGEYFYDEDELRAFDQFLREPWPKPATAQRAHVPEGITREIKIEANHKCAFCEYTNSGEGAHIDAVNNGGCNHPHNLIWCCPNHHTEYDRGYKIGTLVKKDHVIFLKEMLLDARLRHWRIELRAVSHFLAIIEDLRKISDHLDRKEYAALRPKLVELAANLVETAVKSAETDSRQHETSAPSFARYAKKIAALSLVDQEVTSAVLEQTAHTIDEATEEYLDESDLASCPLCKGNGDHNRHRCPVCRGEGTVGKDQVDEIDLLPYKQVKCPLCKGSGDHNRFECPICFGVRTIDEQDLAEVDLKPFAQTECPLCKGSGDHNRFECSVCNGVGTVDEGLAETVDLTPYEQIKCPVCDGRGHRNGGKECPPCRGTGEIDEGLLESLDISQYDLVRCPACSGKGDRKGRECEFCGGTGKADRGDAENFDVYGNE